jgi:hypothetical protein
MRQIRKLLCILLVLCALLPALPAARAEEPDLEDERFAGKTWDEIVEEFLQSWGVDPKKVGLGYYNTVTGEEHYLNPDEYRITASMYKVPLNMVFLDRLSSGEMDWDSNVSGYRYEDVLEQTIVHSNNDIARNMVKWELGKGNWQAGRRVIAPYCGLDPDNVDWKFQENNYSTPRQVIYCLKLLYENPDRFPRLVETMQRAEPTEYFKRRERRFNIAHKYGFLQTDDYHLYMNDCGIAFTDDPILLVLFTDNVPKAYDVMTEFCTLMCDYAQYRRALRLKAESEEAERLEAERQEAERLAAEASQTPEPSPEPSPEIPPEPSAPAPEPSVGETEPPAETAEPPAAPLSPMPPADTPNPPTPTPPTPQKLAERVQEQGLTTTALIAAGLVLLALLIALIALATLGRKYRVRRAGFLVIALLLSLGALGRIFWPAVQELRSQPSGDPQETVRRFFDALAAGDYEQAYACLDGVETLGLEYEPRRESGRAIRAAMRGQFSAELYGDCTVDGERAYQQVNCRYFDVSKLNREAKTEAMLIISRYVSTHPVGDLYNENGNYRTELLLDAWDEAAELLLQTPENYRSSGGVQLELRWHDGAWRIVPNEKLLQLLTGGVKLTEKGGEA